MRCDGTLGHAGRRPTGPMCLGCPTCDVKLLRAEAQFNARSLVQGRVTMLSDEAIKDMALAILLGVGSAREG